MLIQMYYIALLFIATSLYYQAVADNETIINVTEHLESELNNEVNNTSVDVQWYSYIPEENENIIKVIENENIIWEKSNDEKCVEIKYNRNNNNITLVTLRIKTNDTLNFKYYYKENDKWSLEDDDEYETAEEVIIDESPTPTKSENSEFLFSEEYLNSKLQRLIWLFQQSGNVVGDFKLSSTHKDDTGIVRLYYKDTEEGYTMFIIDGELNVSKEQFLHLIMNFDNRSSWETSYVEHEILECYEDISTEIIYYVSKYTGLPSERCYINSRTLFDTADGCTILFTKSSKHKHDKNFEGKIYVDTFENLLILRDLEPETDDGNIIRRCQIFCRNFQNLKARLLKAVINRVTRSFLPSLYKKMTMSAKTLDYQESVKYCNNLKYVRLPPYKHIE